MVKLGLEATRPETFYLHGWLSKQPSSEVQACRWWLLQELATGAEADISRPTRLEPPNDKAVTLPRLMVRMLMPSRSCDGNVTVIGLFARL